MALIHDCLVVNITDGGINQNLSSIFNPTLMQALCAIIIITLFLPIYVIHECLLLRVLISGHHSPLILLILYHRLQPCPQYLHDRLFLDMANLRLVGRQRGTILCKVAFFGCVIGLGFMSDLGVLGFGNFYLFEVL